MQKQGKLLHICSYSWETGGPASFIFNHADYQIKNGMEVDIASAMYSWQNPYKLPAGARLFTFRKSIFSKLISEFSLQMIFWFIKNRNKYDYIHLHGLWHFGSILPFLIPSKAKKIVTIHGFLDTYAMQRNGFLKKIFWVLFQKRFLRKADKLHAMNEEEYQLLLQLFPDKAEHIALIGNGIEDPLEDKMDDKNIESFQLKIEQFSGKEEPVILFIGRKSEKKGLDNLVEAFLELEQEKGKVGKLILAGPSDDFSESLENILKKSTSQNVLELPLVQGAEKDYLFKRADLVVLPSYSEGFSIAALEAMAYGKCSMLSTRIGFAEEANAAQAAIIIEPTKNHVKFALIQYLSGGFDVENLRLNARKLYKSKYTSETICSKLFSFIVS